MFSFDAAGMKKLNEHLADKAYLDGFTISKNDSAIYCGITKSELKVDDLVNIKRWMAHMSTYTLAEVSTFTGKVTACAMCSAGKCDTKKDDKEEGSDFSFGGSEEEEVDEVKKAAIAAAIKAAAARKAAKPKKQERSMIVFHIKPYGDENDMTKVLKEIPEKIQMEGLKWGIGELLDHCYGVKLLAMPCVVVDDICSVDEIQEKIQEIFEDDVQNCDINSFNKFE
ncbi:Translation elongation factor 1-beta [Spironucleus salmonicida]|uniref:Translation elongation factor 1-beta n=1 Tax=Spironucleus salmonicida TaxID=348837 RepID=V6LUC8_9EUKA|nr:Translation elongation factor 1-beta [Spironucleus salmonicida]|eukprot:EST48227.1 Translation elongation factor 1-beta [Spironucleus salmonicida]